ncbi:MAG: sulfatase [Deltaproteobacteria bacterium]|jgi:arylsulfatase A-like enzyme|nr:sulfatase [Deltaproteobacteria bacterium]
MRWVDSLRRTWIEVLFATLLAASIDLTLSAAHGYKLVRPMWPWPPPLLPMLQVVAIQVGVLALFSGALVFAIRLAPLRLTPWIRVLVCAAAPLLLWRAVAGVDASVVIWGSGHLLVIASILGLQRARRCSLRGPGLWETGVALTVFFVALAASLWLPSRALSRIPAAHSRSSESTASAGPNLLMIVLDTVRADHLPPYGYERDTMPFVTGFAARATLFEHAVAASSYTLPSHATLFTGLLPESHGASVVEAGVSLDGLGLEGDTTPVAPLSDEATTLAELARKAGLATGAISANLAYLSPAFGFAQGFDDYMIPIGGWSQWQPAGLAIGRKVVERLFPASVDFWYRSRITGQGRFYLLASEVNAMALRWLEGRRDRRFFLFLNYMDAHAPYLPLPGYRDLHPASDSPQTSRRDALIDAYDAELRYLDDHLAGLFAQLEAWGTLERTLVVIVGDHGESFGEHGEFEHASGLHEHQLHVPLVIRRPGQEVSERVSRSVHLADLLPTVVALLGLQLPDELDGTSVFDDAREMPVTAHLGRYRGILSRDAIYLEPYKLIEIEGEGGVELYDLAADPNEQNDLAVERPDLVRKLSRALEIVKQAAQPHFDRSPADLDEQTRERLRALGYSR